MLVAMYVTTIDLYDNFYSASAKLAIQSAVLAMIDSVQPYVCPTVRHTPVSCQNDSSYDHAVFTGG